MMHIKNPFIRWLAVVAIIMGFTISGHYMIMTLPRLNSDHVFNIHFVNYRGRTAVDAAFERYLTDHGVKYTITYHDLKLNPSNAVEIKQQIEASDVDAIVTWGTSATLGIIGRFDNPTGGKISQTPTVFTLVSYPERSGILPQRDIPRRNVTGSSHMAPLYNQFRTMMAYYPTKHIGMFFTSTELNSILTYQEMRSFCRKHGVDLTGVGIMSNSDGSLNKLHVLQSIEKMRAAGVEWLYLPPDSFLGVNAGFIIQSAHRAKIRTFASTDQLMKAGASYGLISPYELIGAHAAAQVQQILIEGKRAEDIPVDSAPRFIHQVNADALKTMHLEIPMDKLGAIELITSSSIH